MLPWILEDDLQGVGYKETLVVTPSIHPQEGFKFRLIQEMDRLIRNSNDTVTIIFVNYRVSMSLRIQES